MRLTIAIQLVLNLQLSSQVSLRRRIPTHSPDIPDHGSWNPHLTPYPSVRRDSSVVEAFNSKARGVVQVHNPYHWLENIGSAETKTFVGDQVNFTESYLSKYPHRDQLRSAIRTLGDYPSFSLFSLKKDGYYYFAYNSGLQDQSPIYRVKKGHEFGSKSSKSKKEESGPGGDLFFDPNLLSTDGTTSLAFREFSPSAKYVAYGVSKDGGDRITIYVRKTDCPHPKSADQGGIRGQDPGRLPDEVRFVQFNIASWLPDESGFFYSRAPENTGPNHLTSNLNVMIYFHKLGDAQEKDTLIMKDPAHPGYQWYAHVSDDKQYLFLGSYEKTGSNRFWVTELKSQPLGSNMKWKKLVNDFKHNFNVVGSRGTQIYFLTDKDAPQGKMYDLAKPRLGFKDFISEDQHATLNGCLVFGEDKLIVIYLRDVKTELFLYDLATGHRIKQIGKNLDGYCSDMTGHLHNNEIFIGCQSFTNPFKIYRYRYDAHKGEELSLFKATPIKGFASSHLVSEQVFYHSKDGTRIPMFIIHHKDFKRDGTAPGLQYGYGGFRLITKPSFSELYVTFITHYGGVVAVPNIRGGGEYGQDWHLAGSFDDFQWATKYLVAHKYVAPSKVAITGDSNGGTLVGACVNQAPELYGAALAGVGVMDMLRYTRYGVGATWSSEYGDPKDPDAFDWLIKYSPLENVNPNATYPAVLVTTSDNDERVASLHSYKFLAQLQHQLPNNPKPLLLRVDINSGHNGASTVEPRIRELADKLTFVAVNMNLQWKA